MNDVGDERQLNPRLERRKVWGRILGALVSFLPLVGLAAVVFLIGWPHTRLGEQWLFSATRVIAGIYGALFLVHWLLVEKPEEHRRLQRWISPLLALGILLSAIFEDVISTGLHNGLHDMPVRVVLIILATLQQVVAFALRFASWIPLLEKSFLRKLNPGTIFFGTFALLIVFGTLLLKLPNATTDSIGWLDALFTSTSAVCVTGLIVVDTATAFTPLGQGIVLLLIQLGAFGIVALTFFLAVVTGQGFSVTSRIFLRDILNLENLRNMGTALSFLIGFTLIAEGIGWFALYHLWGGAESSIGDLWWVSLFHSISAFCNAGFSIFTAGLADPEAVTNYPVQGVVMILIVLGGLGFPVLMEVFRRLPWGFWNSPRARRFSVHFRLVIAATGVLLAGGALLLFLSGEIGDESSLARKAWVALFNAVTARTAGFNISDMSLLSSAATAIMILLMFIGGSPGGFAGGIKTTTFALAMLNLRRILLMRREVEIFGRRIDETLCNRAFAVLLLSFVWIFVATTMILFFQPQFTLLDTLFETVSAFSTVGLSRGITAALSDPSKVVIIITMFAGRIGVMNFLFSLLVVTPRESRLRLPKERVIID